MAVILIWVIEYPICLLGKLCWYLEISIIDNGFSFEVIWEYLGDDLGETVSDHEKSSGGHKENI